MKKRRRIKEIGYKKERRNEIAVKKRGVKDQKENTLNKNERSNSEDEIKQEKKDDQGNM